MFGFFMGPSWRAVSPSGGSTLITSAPMSPSCWAAHGPSTTVVQSTIRTPLSGPDTARSGLGAAGDHEGLAAHEVAVRAAEEVDRPRGLLGQPPAAERDHLVHGRDARALHADLHLAPGHLDGARLALRERLGEPGLDVAEGHAVHGPVSYTHLRAHETPEHLVCRLLLEKKKI